MKEGSVASMKTDNGSKASRAKSEGTTDTGKGGVPKTAAGKAEPALAVGDKVLTSADPGPSGKASKDEPGVIVDDFAATLVEGADYGRDWALARRWAIQLDNGRLVFRSTDELRRAG